MSNDKNILIRPAEIADTEFIAYGILNAVGFHNPSADRVRRLADLICRRNDTLYSWKNTVIAMSDDAPAGSLTAYDGARYEDMRGITFELLKTLTGHDFTRMDAETRTGEYYLDSLSVHPQFRRKGIGTMLLEDRIEHAKNLGFKTVVLACEPENTNAFNLYRSLGFNAIETIHIFGEDYLRMVLNTVLKDI